jgi:hypothetical protein
MLFVCNKFLNKINILEVVLPSHRNICRNWLFLQLWSFTLFKKYATIIYFVYQCFAIVGILNLTYG